MLAFARAEYCARDELHERDVDMLDESRAVDCVLDEGGAGSGRPSAVDELNGDEPPSEQQFGDEPRGRA